MQAHGHKLVQSMDFTELHDGEIEDILYLVAKNQRKVIHKLVMDIHYSAFGELDNFETFIAKLMEIIGHNPFLKIVNICWVMDKAICKIDPLPIKMKILKDRIDGYNLEN